MSETVAMEADPRDIRPVIATARDSNWGLWAFILVLLIGGLLLFNALNASREAAQVPSVLAPPANPSARISAPGAIAIPERFLEPEPQRVETLAEPVSLQTPVTLDPALQTAPGTASPPMPSFSPPSPPELPPPPPRVVFENRVPTPAIAPQPETPGNRNRVSAGRFLNPSRTIPQGTVIPAVLETAIDSTRPGGVRALVQRDIFGFDGTRLLVPRGSRLYGEYESGIERGQNRAMVQWTRLIRPDGVTIALDSPSSDPLGRAGIRGKVDSKFFQRFGGAILQSVLDIGVGLAVNEASDGVIVALPGSTQNVQVTEPGQVQPTLKVKHGTSVSVFVARDLDFSSVDR